MMLYRLSRPAGFLGKPSTNHSRALNKQKDVKLLTELLWSRGHSQKYIKRFLFKTNKSYCFAKSAKLYRKLAFSILKFRYIIYCGTLVKKKNPAILYNSWYKDKGHPWYFNQFVILCFSAIKQSKIFFGMYR